MKLRKLSLFRPQTWLVLILVLAALLRLVRLDIVPPALYWDEASIGYNAFSIASAGIDEHGTAWPLTHFLAYGDAKPPLYIYVTAVFIQLIGANEWAVRLPSALAGIGAVAVTYLISRQLFYELDFKKALPWSIETCSLLVAALLAISPWHLHVSRVGYEANLALTLFLVAIWAILKAKHSGWYFLLAAVSLVATWYTFNAYRLFVPALLPILGWYHWPRLRTQFMWVSLSIILAIVMAVPLIPFVLSDQAQLRFEEVTIFKNLDPVTDANLRQALNDQAWWSRIIHNRRILFAQEFWDGYFDHLKFDFLFFSGDVNPRLGVQDMGVLYLIELPFLLVGIYYLVKQTRLRRVNWLILGWLALAFVPAAVARETPHALRSLQILPLPQLLIGLGLIFSLPKHRRWRWSVFGLYLLFLIFYLNLYHVHFRKYWADSWQYGYKELVNYLVTVESNYDRIYVTNALGRPHTYLLWHLQYDPEVYVNDRDAGGDAFGFTQTDRFGKFYFTTPLEEPPTDQNWLYVAGPEADLDTQKIQKVVYNLLGEPVFFVHE